MSANRKRGLQPEEHARMAKYWSLENGLMVCNILCNGILSEMRWFFPLLMVGAACGYEAAATQIMDVIGDFYFTISDQNFDEFLQVLWRSLIVITIVSTLKTIATYGEQACALECREQLVRFLHAMYLKDHTTYTLIMGIGGGQGGSGGKRFENPDQRITQDADGYTTQLAHLIRVIIVVPGLIAYYSWVLWDLFGWVGPTGCFVYFIIGALANGMLLHRVVPYVYLQERYEGDFRFRHVWNRVHVEQIAFLKGQQREKLRVDRSFQKIVETRREIVGKHFPLYLSMNWFDYLGAIVNYAAVGLSILYLNQNKDMSSSKIASLVAEGSYSCLYLISSFSVLFDASEVFSEVMGYTARISELLIAMNFTPSQARALSWTRFGECKDGTVICSDERSGAGRQADCWTLFVMDAAVCCHQWLFPRAGYRARKVTTHRNDNSDDNSDDDDDCAFDDHPSRPLLYQTLSATCEEDDDASSSAPLLAGGPRFENAVRNRAHQGRDYTDLFTGFVGETHRASTSGVQYPDSAVLAVDSLTVCNPDRKILVRDLTFAMEKGDRMLVVGPSGVGKSSLVRVLAGLWKAQTGSIVLPNPQTRVFYLPQRAYAFYGSLRDQVTYPYPAHIYPKWVDSVIVELLQSVRLHHLLNLRPISRNSSDRSASDAESVVFVDQYAPHLSRTEEWSQKLSGGEQQRLAVARALFHAPDIIVLDEATSAVDENDEQLLYDLLIEKCSCVLSFGHRPSLGQYHDRKLSLSTDGTWTMHTI